MEEQILELSVVDPDRGLTAQQVQQRQEAGLDNQVTARAGRTEKDIILQNILTFFNLVFVVLAVVLVIGGSSVKNMTFLIVVLINTAIGIFQEIRAKRAVDKLTLIAAQKVRTLRDGKVISVRSDLLVQDDIVEFGPGDQICADGVVHTGLLQVNESLLTGESDLVAKQPGDILRSGSFVVAGRGRARLTQVGDASFAARLAAEAKADPRAAKSEMMRSLDHLVRFMGIVLIPVGLLLFYDHFKVGGMDLRPSTEKTVAALVGMIPEGLYLLTSIALALSSLKLTRDRVLVQDMNCIETLARVDVLCVDKTGTITEPGMEVESIVPLSAHSPEYLEQVLTALYGSREPDNDTARALQELFSGESPWKCTRYIPFTSQTKYSGGVFEDEGAFLTGAPDMIMGKAYSTIRPEVEPWLQKGYRVLLVARYDGEPVPGALEEDRINPLALVLLTGKIRPQAMETFSYFDRQGVTIKVISGDNAATASEVARRAGIRDAERYIDMSAVQTDEELYQAARTCTVFGRVTPEQKRKLIRALKKQGHTVAMTGDGVNDVLAMKDSDCGIAMASGAQAASQVARMVLLDSDFSAMPGIVGEGRRVINNIQRAAALFLVKNIFSLGLALVCLFTHWAYPFMPIHLTLVSALTIGVPSFFLAIEPNYERVRGKFLPGVLRRAFPGGLTNIIVVLICQAIMENFALPSEDIATVCTGVLAVVGLLVLFLESRPFNWMRKLVLGAMAVAFVGAYLLLGGLFDLAITDSRSYLVLLSVVIMAPTVFFALQWLFTQIDRLWNWLKNRKKN